ncbi:hypothetical protein BKA63DRAFT_603910 [Paraphoma chrysanthemicola]|nr:hypothetical protein BKA63DRAFT_603910 [Paraphoma chrysanthemicola]
MFSQHRKLAVVWDTLQRNNACTALREVIGQHALRNTLTENDEIGTGAGNDQAIAWIKTIFDLQRCYLIGATDALHLFTPIKPCLIPPELLYSSILYLIRTGRRSRNIGAHSETKHLAHSELVWALTILSGLRLLLLYKDSISRQNVSCLQKALGEAWTGKEARVLEDYIIQHICSNILGLIKDQDHADAYTVERGNAQLPTYASGIYPLDIKPEVSVTPLIIAIAEEDEDCVDAYIVLYDFLWAIESAITQRYIDLGRLHGTSAWEPSTIENDEIFEQLYHQRSSLIISIFHFKGAMLPSNTIMESLAATLFEWDDSLDSFLSRQDSILQHQMTSPTTTPRYAKYKKLVANLQPLFEVSLTNLAEFLAPKLALESEDALRHLTTRQPGLISSEDTVTKWIHRIAAPNTPVHVQHVDGPNLPVYVVDCSKLHAVPSKYLAYQLRWSDKWAYESLEEHATFVQWKEGVRCPSCESKETIKCARLLEPLHRVAISEEQETHAEHGQSQYSGASEGSYMLTSASSTSQSVSSGALSTNFPGQSTMNISVPTTVSQPSSELSKSQPMESRLPNYTESPVSPLSIGVEPQRTRSDGSIMPANRRNLYTASLDLPIPIDPGSRRSMNLPIPVHTPLESSSGIISRPTPFDLTRETSHGPSSALTWSAESYAKPKSVSRSARIASSMRRKPTTKGKGKTSLPADPCFSFSSTGNSMFFWGKNGDRVARFETSSSDAGAMQACRYDVEGVEAVAAGGRRCAVIAAKTTSKKKLMIFDGLTPTTVDEIELDVNGRSHEACIAVSKDDKHVAVSMNDQIDLFILDRGLKKVAFQHQMDVYELRGGLSQRRSIAVARTTSDDSVTEPASPDSGGWFGAHTKALNFKEAAEEQSRQTAVISRKLYFSTDSQRLVVATQLGDHCVYIDVYDITREPVGTISEHSRSFKLPPWVLNDGDITSVFYDSAHRAALVTAFLGKEYPVMIPFPGYDPLQNETYSTKIVAAAQSPSGSTLIVANAMTEIIQFEYTSKGTLSPRKLKKASGKMSNSVFKPGAIVLGMPEENVLLAFWIRDGKCILRTIQLGGTETIKDVDIREQYDRLMSLERPVVKAAESVGVPELDAGDFI